MLIPLLPTSFLSLHEHTVEKKYMENTLCLSSSSSVIIQYQSWTAKGLRFMKKSNYFSMWKAEANGIVK